eukprot:tig00001264_g7886.t1
MPPLAWALEVLEATYGILGNPERSLDVTAAVQTIIDLQGGDLLYMSSKTKNLLEGFADRAIFFPKRLRLVVRETCLTPGPSGEPAALPVVRSLTYAEYDEVFVVAGTPEDPVAVVRGTYGLLGDVARSADVTDVLQMMLHAARAFPDPRAPDGLVRVPAHVKKDSIAGFVNAAWGVPKHLKLSYVVKDRFEGRARALLLSEADAVLFPLPMDAVPAPGDLPASCLGVLTTAALPWHTGTSINPLFRAVYAARRGLRVLLALPWLPDPDQQALIYPPGVRFARPSEQRAYIEDWLVRHCGQDYLDLVRGPPPPEEDPRGAPSPRRPLRPNGSLRILFYRAYYSPALGSVFCGEASGWHELAACMRRLGARAVVLEEPEHIGWLTPLFKWSEHFAAVLGVVHTNYEAYVREHGPRATALTALLASASFGYDAAALRAFSAWVVRRNCHRVVLAPRRPPSPPAPSSSPPPPARGRRGPRAASPTTSVPPSPAPSPVPGAEAPVGPGNAYFVGKLVWAKGLRELLDALALPEAAAPGAPPVALDVYGAGPDQDAMRAYAERLAPRLPAGTRVRFCGPMALSDPRRRLYSVFVNPSLSEVLCTTTAEALAMDQMAVLPAHPSNAFFTQFSNCRSYDPSKPAELLACLHGAIRDGAAPHSLSDDERHTLSWHAATERLFSVLPGPEWDLL